MDIHHLLWTLRAWLSAVRRFDIIEDAHRWESCTRHGNRGLAKRRFYNHRGSCPSFSAPGFGWNLPGHCSTWWCDWTIDRWCIDTVYNVGHSTYVDIGFPWPYFESSTLTVFHRWRWCFYINLPPGAVVAAIWFFTAVPDGQIVKPKPVEVAKDLHNKLDLVGFAFFAPSCIMLLLAVQWGGNE